MKNIKDLLGDLEAPTEEKTIKVTLDENLEQMLKNLSGIFEQELNRHWEMYSDPKEYLALAGQSLLREEYKITPRLISEFVLQVYKYGGEPNFGKSAGVFLTALIQQSFQQGHNNFTLQLTGSEPLHYLGMRLHGEANEKLKIEVANCGVYKQTPITWPTYVPQQLRTKHLAGTFTFGNGLPYKWFTYAKNLDVKITGVSRDFLGLADYAERCRFGVDNEIVLAGLKNMFSRASHIGYSIIDLSKLSEAYLLEKEEPNVSEVDGDSILKTFEDAKTNFNLVRMVA